MAPRSRSATSARASRPTTASSRRSTASRSRSSAARRSASSASRAAGKSVTCLTIMGLNNRRNTVSSGEALFNGEDLLQLSPRRLRELRGNDIAMIFQDPMTSLNPVHTIGEAARRGREAAPRRDARRTRGSRALELLEGGRDPARRAADRRLPAPVLGRHAPARDDRDGADQRPRLLIADEPTTALDVTTQAQILELMTTLQDEFGTAIVMITHDLGVVAEIADEVVVMYAGRVAEEADGRRDLRAPAPPVHLGPARLAAPHRRRRRAAGADPGPAAVAAQPAAGLPLPSALPVRARRSADRPSRCSSRCRTSRGTSQACHLDEATKDGEVAKLLEGTLAEVGG